MAFWTIKLHTCIPYFKNFSAFVHLQWRLDQFVNSWIGSVNNLPYCLIFKVSIKNQSMHEIEKKIMVSFPVEKYQRKCISAFSPQAHWPCSCQKEKGEEQVFLLVHWWNVRVGTIQQLTWLLGFCLSLLSVLSLVSWISDNGSW